MKAALVARWPAPDGSQPSGALVASLLARWQNVDSSHTDQGTARKRKSELQTLRRQKCRDLNEIIATQSVDIAEADKLVSKLLVTRPDLVPQSSRVRDEAVESVKQEVTLAFHNLTKDLPERSRLKRTIVTRLCQIKGRMFTVAEREDICGVAEGYVRKGKHRRRVQKKDHELDPLYAEKMRGFSSAPRDSVATTEISVILDWTRGEMVVRSGCHRETFRLEVQKQLLLQNFNCSYPRLLRQMIRRNPALQATVFTSTTHFTLFHRNVERALWLARQPGFEEGSKANMRRT